MRQKASILLIISTLLLISCDQQKPIKPSDKITGIVFCIDDYAVEDFYQEKHYNYIQTTGIKMTYFICKYHKLSEKQKKIIKIFQADGHEIGFHGTHHIHAKDFLDTSTIEKYLDYEIKPDLKKMRDDGLDITDFSYPYGSHTPKLDSFLLHNLFYFIKLGRLQKFYYNLNEPPQIIHPFPLDERYWKKYKITLDQVIQFIDSAFDQNKIIMFYGHGLTDEYTTERNAIWFDKFRLIMNYVKEKRMKFYTLNDLKQFGKKDIILKYNYQGKDVEIDEE